MREAHTPEERLAELIAELPAVPQHLVAAAVALPALHREVDAILETVGDRDAVRADPEAAIRATGREPSPALVAAVRRAVHG
jgi:hypothetical protein